MLLLRKDVLFIFILIPHSTGERREEEARGGGQAAELRVSDSGLGRAREGDGGEFPLQRAMISLSPLFFTFPSYKIIGA